MKPDEWIPGVHNIRLTKIKDKYVRLNFHSVNGHNDVTLDNIRSIHLNLHESKISRFQEIGSTPNEPGWLDLEFKTWDHVCKFNYMLSESRMLPSDTISIECIPANPKWKWEKKK